jgi:predicted AAA+ superfamily ATPase
MKRDIDGHLREMLTADSRHDVILVEGARQVGKSTMVSQVLTDIGGEYVAIDLEKDRRIARKIDKTADFNDFKVLMQDQCGLRDNSVLFLDEAQECPVLARYVKSFKEDWDEVRVILTGSSMHRLFTNENRIPVGRTRSLCVYPFSYAEFLRCIGHAELADFVKSAPIVIPQSRHEYLLELYDQYLRIGGYPEAVKAYAAGESAASVIDDIMGSLQDDFVRKELFDSALFGDAVRAVANHVGCSSKYTHINTTKYHARRVIESLKSWHIIIEVGVNSLDPLHSDFLPKRYLHDLGAVGRYRSMVVPSLSLLGTLDPALRTPLGGLFENAVLLSLLEGESAKREIGTWRKSAKSSTEVDFVLDAADAGIRVPIECKAALKIKRRHVDGVGAYLSAAHQHFGVVVSADSFGVVRQADDYHVLNIPVYLASKSNILSYAYNSEYL